MIVSEKLKTMSVLFAEDDEMSRSTIGRLLSTRFANVYLAENGRAGLEKFGSLHPDVVITDLEMPVMNGMEMIRRIRELGPEIPIIITTGYDDDEHATDLADRTLVKPIIFSKLMDAVESCVQERLGLSPAAP
jgi:CheY-like chemotaxis protein